MAKNKVLQLNSTEILARLEIKIKLAALYRSSPRFRINLLKDISNTKSKTVGVVYNTTTEQ